MFFPTRVYLPASSSVGGVFKVDRAKSPIEALDLSRHFPKSCSTVETVAASETPGHQSDDLPVFVKIAEDRHLPNAVVCQCLREGKLETLMDYH
jgi:hypothetical protein